MISANEMREIADKFNEERRQEWLPNLEAALASVVFNTEEEIRQRAANGEYSVLTPDLLLTLRTTLGPSMPTSVRKINELVAALSAKLKEYFLEQGFSAYAVAPLDRTGYYLKIKWGGDEQ